VTSIKVDDSQFMAAFAGLVQTDREKSHQAMSNYGEAAVGFMRRHIDSKSGELAGSLRVEEHFDGEGDQPWVEVGAFEDGTADPHGLYTEFGTSKEAARPFARPGLEEAGRDFRI
jgi:hypothetical protein